MPTYATNNLYGTPETEAAAPRVVAKRIDAKTFASPGSAVTIAKLTPVAFDTTTSQWKVWSGVAAVNEVQTLTVDATGGTFTLTFDGETTAAIAENASAATVQAALEALSNLQPGDVTVTGSAGGPWTITFGGTRAQTNVPAITTDAGSLTGGAGTAVIATSTAGVAGTGKDVIRGFVWPEAIVTDATNSVIGCVLIEGEVHYDDIVLPSGESAATLKEALRSGCRDRGLHIMGLGEVR